MILARNTLAVFGWYLTMLSKDSKQSLVARSYHSSALQETLQQSLSCEFLHVLTGWDFCSSWAHRLSGVREDTPSFGDMNPEGQFNDLLLPLPEEDEHLLGPGMSVGPDAKAWQEKGITLTRS